jgi:protease-4
MGDVAASGGYYVASASDVIYSDAATITGSIGVIFLSANLSRLLEKIGVQMEVIKSGRFKDMGSFSRALTPPERALIQSVVSDTYQQFVQAVARGRKLPVAKVRALADGRIYSGRQAKQLGLVDKIGGLQDAVREAASRAGITGTPQVREIGRRRLLDRLLDLQSRSLVDRLYLAYYDLLGPTPVR